MDSHFDPGRITWQKESWHAAPAMLDSNNPSSTKLKLYIRVEQMIPANGYIIVSNLGGLSETQSITEDTTSIHHLEQSSIVLAGAEIDLEIAIDSSAAASTLVGPFSIVSRACLTCQIIDANYAFASVYIAAEVTPTENILIVSENSLTPSTDPTIGGTMNLKFDIATLNIDLWPHDTIIISVGLADFLAPTSPICNSMDTDNSDTVTNHLCETDVSSCALHCETVNNEIIIYGLETFVNHQSDNTAILLEINSWTLPKAAYSKVDMEWTVSFYRFGTTTLLKSFTATGPADVTSLTASTLVCGSHGPHRGSTNVFDSQILFYKISCTIGTALGVGDTGKGSMTVTFENVVLEDYPLATPATNCVSTQGNCAAGGLVLTISEIDGSYTGSIDVTTYINVGTTGPKFSVATINTSSKDVQTLGDQVIIVNDGSGTIKGLDAANIKFRPNSGTVDPTDAAAEYITATIEDFFFAIYAVENTGTTDQITIAFPFVNDVATGTKARIKSDATLNIGFDSVVGAGDLTIAQHGKTATNPSLSSGTISVQYDGATDSIVATHLISIRIVQDGDGPVMPLYVSNVETYYEYYVTYKNGDTNTYYGYDVFTTTASELLFSLSTICKANVAQGLPYLIQVAAYNFNWNSEWSFELTGSAPDNTPDAVAKIGVGKILKDDSFGADVNVSLGIDGIVTIGTLGTGNQAGFDIIFPLPDEARAGAMESLTLYSDETVMVANTEEKITIATFEVDYPALITTAASGTLGTLAYTGVDKVGDPYTGTVSAWGDTEGNGAGTSGAVAGAYLGFGPFGHYLDASSATLVGAQTLTPITLISTDNDWNYNYIMGVSTAEMFGTALVLGGLNPESMQTQTIGFFESIDATSTGNGICKQAIVPAVVDNATAGAANADLAEGVITNVSTTNEGGAAKGPSSVNQTARFTFTPDNDIPTGGSVEYDLGAFWTTTENDACSIITGASTATCTYTSGVGPVVTVTDAGPHSGSMVIEITKMYPSDAIPTTGDEDCLTSITTKDHNGDNIDIFGALNKCTLTGPADPGTTDYTSNASVKLYPNAGNRVSDIYFSVKFTKELPVGTSIDIKSSTSDFVDSINLDNCWSSVLYSSCSAVSATLTIVINESISANSEFEVFVSQGVNIGAPDDINIFTIVTSWNGIDITDDTAATTDTTYPVTYKTAGTAMADGVCTPSIKTIGEYSNYAITFKHTEDINAADEIWVIFPPTYDPNIGMTFESTAGTHMLWCSSSVFTSIQCKVDHWRVVITGLKAYEVSSTNTVDITLNYVKNTQSASQNLSIVVINSQAADTDLNFGPIISQFYDALTCALTTGPGFLDVRDVSPSSSELTVDTSNTFMFYVGATLETNDKIIVGYPMQYLLAVSGVTSSSCSGKYIDEVITDSSATSEFAIESSGSCTVAQNWVEFTYTGTDNLVLESTDRNEFTIGPFGNPRFGLMRSENEDGTTFYDVDINAIDNEIFSEYHYWTSSFTISVFDADTSAITYQSFAHRNSAYIGLGSEDNTERVSLQTGDYNAKTGEDRIIVQAGTQSAEVEVTFTNEQPLIANTLTISGSVSEVTLWVEDSTTDWTYALLEDDVDFRVSAATGLSAGYYYITWTITSETKESCFDQAIYGPGPRALVEVQTGTTSISFTSTVSAYSDYSSYPIKFTLLYPPASGLTISVVFTGNAEKLNASDISFEPGETEKYMTLLITAAEAGSYTGTLSKSGTDAASYTLSADTLSVTVSTTVPTQATAISIENDITSLNEGSITVTGGGDGITYVALKCSQSTTGYRNWYTLAEMKNYVSAAGATAMNPTMDEMTYSSSNDFYQFLKDIYQQACYTEHFMAEAHVTSSKFEFDWLADSTYYTAIVWNEASVGLSSNETDVFVTGSSPSQKTITVLVESLVNVTTTASNNYTIACELAELLQVPTYFLYLTGPTSALDSTDNTQFESTYVWTVLFNRLTSAEYTPSTFMADFDITDASKAIEAALFSTEAATNTVTVSEGELSAGTTPSTTGLTVAKDDTGTGSLTFKFSGNTSAGQLCSVCVKNSLDDSSFVPLVSQIPYGLSAGAHKSDYMCMDIEATTIATAYDVKVSGLSEDTAYRCYHAVCDTNKLLPTCAYLDTTGSDSTDFASLLATFSLVFALIFN